MEKNDIWEEFYSFVEEDILRYMPSLKEKAVHLTVYVDAIMPMISWQDALRQQ